MVPPSPAEGPGVLHIPFGQSRGRGPGGVGGAVQRPRGHGGLPGPARGNPGTPPPVPPYGLGGVELILFCLFKFGFKVLFLPRAGFGGLRPQPGRTCSRPGGWGGSKEGAGAAPAGSPRGPGAPGLPRGGGPRPEGRQRPSPPRGWPKGLSRYPRSLPPLSLSPFKNAFFFF